MVAKTYQSWKKLSEPFMENKRLYIMVERPKGGEKKVRWYNEAEYARMYPEEKKDVKKFKPQKEVLGYHDGYIWIFNNFDHDDEWMKNSVARYGVYCGWYIPSNVEIPAGAPPVEKLEWSRVGNVEGYLIPEKVEENKRRMSRRMK